MIKTIELTREKFARLLEKEPFLLPDILKLDFQSIGYDLTQAFITLKNGEVKEKFLLEKPFTVPEKFLFAGMLNISIDTYHKGMLVKHWDCLPIKVVETEEEMHCFEYVAELEKEIKDLKENTVSKVEYEKLVNKINEIIDKQNEIAETVSEIKENYVAEAKNIL